MSALVSVYLGRGQRGKKNGVEIQRIFAHYYLKIHRFFGVQSYSCSSHTHFGKAFIMQWATHV